MSKTRRTNVYVDGFNLFYGAVKGTSYKWLDIEAMCRRLLDPSNQIQRLRYFTARIAARPDNPQGPARQDAYLRALQTLPCVSVHMGRFLTKPCRMPLVYPTPGGPKTVEVIRTDEKGSDVNLATYLLADAFRDDADVYVVISNDSDLMEPMRLVRHELGRVVGNVNPHPPGKKSLDLQNARPSFFRQLHKNVVAQSQFPPTLRDAQGAITKPPDW